MEDSKINMLILRSLEPDSDTREIAGELEDLGITYDFSEDFEYRIGEKILLSARGITRELEFTSSLFYIFKRIAVTGIAAIVLLLLSIYMMEGTFSLNSFLGLGNINDESLVYLLTGN